MDQRSADAAIAARGLTMIVLSNNDGCAVARSAEAKVLGIKQRPRTLFEGD